MDSFVYYIGKAHGTNTSNDVKGGIRVFRLSTVRVLFEFEDLDGPFTSIPELRKNSGIFKRFQESHPHQAQKIFTEQHIQDIKEFVLSSNENVFEESFIKCIEHSVRGDFKSREVGGIHYFDNRWMTIKKILGGEDQNGVWRAVITVKNPESGKCFEKESSFFPKGWTIHQLFHECYYAYQNKVKVAKKIMCIVHKHKA